MLAVNGYKIKERANVIRIAIFTTKFQDASTGVYTEKRRQTVSILRQFMTTNAGRMIFLSSCFNSFIKGGFAYNAEFALRY